MNRRRLLTSTAALALVPPATARATGTSTGPAAGHRKPFAVVGYLPAYSTKRFHPPNAAHYTDLVLFNLRPEADGSLEATNLPDATHANARALREHNPDLRFTVSLGGWGHSETFATVAADPALRATLVESLAAYCDTHQLSGVDYDWEHPKDDVQRDHYAALIQDTAKVFHPRGRTVTAAVSAWQPIDANTATHLDRVHLMAYDYGGRHSTREHAASAVSTLLEKGIPAAKICLGIPFYGRKIDRRTDALTYAKILTHHPPASADDDESAGYFFNGPATVAAKTQLALDRNLAGVMVWEAGQDAPAPHALAAHITATVATSNRRPQ